MILAGLSNNACVFAYSTKKELFPNGPANVGPHEDQHDEEVAEKHDAVQSLREQIPLTRVMT